MNSKTTASRQQQQSGLSTALPWIVGGIGALVLLRALRRSKEFSLRDKVVLVTGGTRGLGLVLARELVREGARVVIGARNQDELDRAFDELAARGDWVMAIPCDVTDREQVQTMVDSVLERWGRIDVLINNAGTISVGPVETMTVEDYDSAMKTHFWGPLFAIQAVLPQMRERREGRIVNIASIGGKISVPHLVPYNASKFALVGLSEGLRVELAKDGVLVTTICPGLIRTGSPRQAYFKGQHRAEYAWFSISDSLPLVSMSARQAARKIIKACKRGEAQTILSVPAKLAVALHDLFPGMTAQILSLINRMLPKSGDVGRTAVQGKDSESFLSPSWLTALGDSAANENNEIDAGKWHPSKRFSW
jgi:NAD(P)-dependent dehydrogenase (short-subunit alcohol dehydrogenase family)